MGLEGFDLVDLSLSLPSLFALFRFVPVLEGVWVRSTISG
jgi:hypothetical protein